MKTEDLLSQARELKPELDKLVSQFHSTHEPDEDGYFLEYDKNFSDEFSPSAVNYNRLTAHFMRKVLEKRFGNEYKGIYPATGQDIELCAALGPDWFLIDRVYKSVDGETDHIPSKWKGWKGAYFSASEARVHFIAHDLNGDDLPKRIEEAKPFQVSLFKNPAGQDTGFEERLGYVAPDSEDYDYPRVYRGALRCCIYPLHVGGIIIAEEDFNPESIGMKGDEAKKANNYLRYYKRFMNRMTGLLDIEGLNAIDIFTYGPNRGDTRPRNIEFAFYERVR
jgi:hypothetical protein